MRDLMHDDQTTTAATPPPVPPNPSAPRGSRRSTAWLAPVAAVLLLSLVAGALFATHARQPGVAPTKATATPSQTLARGAAIELNAVAMTSASDGWAVGSFRPATDSNGSATQVELMHVTNGTWSTVHVPVLGSLNAISMLSASDGWAVGDLGLILHYDGHSWTRVPSPPTTFLHAVQMLAPNDGWAVGDSGSPDGAILHYDGAAWTSQPLPASLGAGTQNAVSLYGLAMTSPDDGWAVGAFQPIGQPTPGVTTYYPTVPPTALILRYTHGRWTVAATIPGATLQSVSVSPSGAGWATGRTDTFTYNNAIGPGPADVFSPLLLRLTGSSWARVTSPAAASDSFLAVLAGPASASWLVAGPDRTGAPGLLRFDGRAWSAMRIPTIGDTREWVIVSLAMPSATEGWAVGFRFSNRDNGIPTSSGIGYQPTVTPVILHYLNGQWSVYTS